MPFHELIQHMETNKHPQNSVSLSIKDCHELSVNIAELHLDLGKFNVTTSKIECDANIFFNLCQVRDGAFYHWIHFFGSPTEAKKYAYTLEYKDVTEAKRDLTYNGQVVSIDETAASIQASYNCLSVTFGFFKAHFIDKDRRFQYSVKIRNLKEEVKDENFEYGISDNDE